MRWLNRRLPISELVGDAQKFDSASSLGFERRASPHLRGDVEGAALDARLPDGGRRLGKPGARRRRPSWSRDLSMSAAMPGHSVRADARRRRAVCDRLSTTAFLRSQIRVQKTTSCASVKGAIGHILHIKRSSSKNVVLLTLRSAIASWRAAITKTTRAPLPRCRVAERSCAALPAAPASSCFGRSVALHLGTARAT